MKISSHREIGGEEPELNWKFITNLGTGFLTDEFCLKNMVLYKMLRCSIFSIKNLTSD